MPTLYWAITWEFGSHAVDSSLEAALSQVIRERLAGKRLTDANIGVSLPQIRIKTTVVDATCTAELRRVDPPDGLTVGPDTKIVCHSALQAEGKAGGPQNAAVESELDGFVLWQIVFDPSVQSARYLSAFARLAGIDKEAVLGELETLLLPPERKERWSLKYYGVVAPALSIVVSKPPVVVFAGDPGTGKTALATSIGAPLSVRLAERVHFKHISLQIRGMGYQGRASGMVAKFFERVRREYANTGEPSLLLFDEAEAVVGSRAFADGSSGGWENRAIVDTIINELDSLRKGKLTRVVAIFSTNLPDQLDAALLRRCYVHRFERPSDPVRQVLFAQALHGLGFASGDINRLVNETRPRKVHGVEVGFTHSDIVELIVGRAIDAAIQADSKVTVEQLLHFCRTTSPTERVGAH